MEFIMKPKIRLTLQAQNILHNSLNNQYIHKTTHNLNYNFCFTITKSVSWGNPSILCHRVRTTLARTGQAPCPLTMRLPKLDPRADVNNVVTLFSICQKLQVGFSYKSSKKKPSNNFFIYFKQKGIETMVFPILARDMQNVK